MLRIVPRRVCVHVTYLPPSRDDTRDRAYLDKRTFSVHLPASFFFFFFFWIAVVRGWPSFISFAPTLSARDFRSCQMNRPQE